MELTDVFGKQSTHLSRKRLVSQKICFKQKCSYDNLLQIYIVRVTKITHTEVGITNSFISKTAENGYMV